MAKYKKQKDGRYRTRISTGKFDDDGKSICVSLSARTIHELEEKVAEVKHQIAVDGLIYDSTTTFKEYASKWLEVYKGSRGVATVNMYKNILDHHCGDINELKLKEISRMAIQNLINKNKEHPRTCEQTVLTIKQVLKSAVNEKLLTHNPCVDIELPRHIKKEKRALTEAEIEAIKNAELDLSEKTFIYTLFGTGMRPSEMYALTKADLDYKRCCISVNKSIAFDGDIPTIAPPKTDSGVRDVFVSKSLIKLLKEYSLTIPHLNLFGDEKGQIMKKYRYRSKFDSIIRKIFGAETDITPYTFRHNFCTMCYHQGLSLKACQAQMGHKSHKLVLDVYTHLDSQKEKLQEKMDSICL